MSAYKGGYKKITIEVNNPEFCRPHVHPLLLKRMNHANQQNSFIREAHTQSFFITSPVFQEPQPIQISKLNHYGLEMHIF